MRRPASELKDDSDLGQIAVTVDVPRLDESAVQRALAAGQRRARELQATGLIWSAVLSCQGRYATVDAERQDQLPDDLPRSRAAPKLTFGGGPLGSVFA